MKKLITFSAVFGLFLMLSCTKDSAFNLQERIDDFALTGMDLNAESDLNGNCNDFNPNIAYGKLVTLHGGDFFTEGWGGGIVVDEQSIVDGIFFPRQHQWDRGPVWWDSNDGDERWIEINLGGLYKITSLIVQADDNDAYKLLHWMNPMTGTWESLWDIPNYDIIPEPDNWGMQTRPNPADDTERHCLAEPIFTPRLRFEGNMDDSDLQFAVSEIQAFGIQIVPVDIKPGSCPNPINTKSKGVLPVAILGMPSLDVSHIDPASIKLEGVSPLRWAFEDVGSPYRPFVGKENAYDCHEMGADDFMDLSLKFVKSEIVKTLGNVEKGRVLILQLTGVFKDGYPFEGEDVMVVAQ